MNGALWEYILEGWLKTVRQITREQADASPQGLLWLPAPYTVPCAEHTFQCLFYWDTYFANLGLMRSRQSGMAKNNIRNFIYLIDTYGYIPNGSRKKYLTRSQPPFFGMMLRDYLQRNDDPALEREGIRALKKELLFWNTERLAPNGLNHYSCHGDRDFYLQSLRSYEKRTGILRAGDREYLGKNAYAEAESGWDFCGRFQGRCYEYNPVDLNALLWFDEAYLAEKTEGDERLRYAAAAEERRRKMVTLMQADDGVFYDYSYVTGTRGKLKSCAAFYPLFTGMTDGDEGVDALLSALELPYGLQASEPTDGHFQWGAENGWGCLQEIACEGLLHCGRQADAERIAGKYTALVESCFERTGHLWEKYNVRTGTQDAVAEYGTPQMLGWTAGVYQKLITDFGNGTRR